MNAPPKPLDGRELPSATPASQAGLPASESAPVSTSPSAQPTRKRERKRRPKFVL